MDVRFRLFESSTESWEMLFERAARFSSSIPADRLISISHPCDRSRGVVTVWYRGKEVAEE